MKITYRKWNKINDVPYVILDWAKYIGGQNITVVDVNELVTDYDEYVSKLDDIEQHESTID
jgi:hypothetical protein